MKEIDEKWAGTVKLQQACIDNQDIMDRFQQLYKDHEDADFKTYEMLVMNEKHWLFNWIGPWVVL